jgi:hypothetical protein
MSSLLLPRRFYNQPQGAVAIDRGNTLGARVIGGGIPGIASFGPGTSSLVQSSLVATRNGVGMQGGSGRYCKFDNAERLRGREAGLPASSRNLTLLFVYDALIGNGYFYNGESDGVSGNWNIRRISGLLNAEFSQGNLFTSVSVPDSGVLIVHGGTHGGENAACWVNGLKSTSSTSCDSWPISPAYSVFFGSSAYPIPNPFPGIGSLAIVLKGNVTDNEALSLSANPWQIFKVSE